MKPRWINLLGRIGSILLVIGLALALVSRIPLSVSRVTSTNRFILGPEKYSLYISPNYTGVYSPQMGLRISVTTNNSLQLYLLSAHPLRFTGWAKTWIAENFPNLNEAQISMGLNNASVLEALVQAHSTDVLLNEEVKGNFSTTYFPQKITNATIVVSNPSLIPVDVNVEVKGLFTVVPRERVVTPAITLIVSGIVLVLPWTIGKGRDYFRS